MTALSAGHAHAAKPTAAPGSTQHAAPGSPATGPVGVEGYVVAIEGGDLILDLGSTRGVSEGEHLELWRPLKLVHPVTRRIVSDRYRIGSIVVEQVRPTISLGKLDETPLRPPAPGDIVIAAPA